MKKFNVVILVILMCTLFVFTGCTKASNATVEIVYNLYTRVATKYSRNNDEILFNDNKLNLSSENAYSANAYGLISEQNGDAALSILNMLKPAAEYDTILSAVSSFFLYKSINDSSKEIPQKYVSQFYEEVDALDSLLENLLDQKRILENALSNFKNSYRTSLIVNLDSTNYFKAYGKVINQVFKINQIVEDIYTNYIVTIIWHNIFLLA